MKKIVSMLLAMVMSWSCLFALTACGGGVDNTGSTLNSRESTDVNDDDDWNESEEDFENDDDWNQDEDFEDDETGNGSGEVIDMSDIVTVTAGGFREGLAFVCLSSSSTPDLCINKEGQVVFSLPWDKSAGIYASALTSFCDGWAMVRISEHESGSTYVLCDKKGNLTLPKELGATGLFTDGATMYSSISQAFLDGYILAKRSTVSFMGSVDELAIFNTKLEKIVDYSKELAEVCNSILLSGSFDSGYYNGFLYSTEKEGKYINLNTGEYGDKAELFEKMPLKHKSDFWAWDDYDGKYCIYDERETLFLERYGDNRMPMIDLSAYKTEQNEMKVWEFQDGLAGMIFAVKDSDVYKRYYFTLIDELGNFKFEPIEVLNGYSGNLNDLFSIKSFNGTFIVACPSHAGMRFTTFDANGKIAEKEYSYEWDAWSCDIEEVSNGAIAFELVGWESYLFLDLNTLELLY